MSHDEIRKLLGGYATNTLTDAERKALLEASLEDQELFNALHQEQALKDLLDDPFSREQIQRALEKPSEHARARPRWWAWTAAAGAVAASVVIFAVVRSNAPAPSRQVASLQVSKSPAAREEKLEAADSITQPITQPPPSPRMRAARPVPPAQKDSKTFRAFATGAMRAGAAGAPPAPAASAPAPQPPSVLSSSQQVQVETGPPPVPSAAAPTLSELDQNRRDLNQSQGTQQGVVGGLISGAPGQNNVTPVTYILLRRDQTGAYRPIPAGVGLEPGDSVRLTVAPTQSGYLFLSRQAVSGEWTRVFPQTGLGLPVNAYANYTIPDAPIDVTVIDQKFRLTVTQAAVNSFGAKTTELKKQSAVSAPLFVDFVIGPKKTP